MAKQNFELTDLLLFSGQSLYKSPDFYLKASSVHPKTAKYEDSNSGSGQTAGVPAWRFSHAWVTKVENWSIINFSLPTSQYPAMKMLEHGMGGREKNTVLGNFSQRTMDSSTWELVSFWVILVLSFELLSVKAASFLSAWLSCWLPTVHLVVMISFGIMGLCFVSASIKLTHVESYPHSMPLWHWEHLESFRSRNLVKDLLYFQIIRPQEKNCEAIHYSQAAYFTVRNIWGAGEIAQEIKSFTTHAWHPQFDPCDSQSRKKSWWPRSCPLTSMCGQQDLFIQPYNQTYEMNESKCSIFELFGHFFA